MANKIKKKPWRVVSVRTFHIYQTLQVKIYHVTLEDLKKKTLKLCRLFLLKEKKAGRQKFFFFTILKHSHICQHKFENFAVRGYKLYLLSSICVCLLQLSWGG